MFLMAKKGVETICVSNENLKLPYTRLFACSTSRSDGFQYSEPPRNSLEVPEGSTATFPLKTKAYDYAPAQAIF